MFREGLKGAVELDKYTNRQALEDGNGNAADENLLVEEDEL